MHRGERPGLRVLATPDTAWNEAGQVVDRAACSRQLHRTVHRLATRQRAARPRQRRPRPCAPTTLQPPRYRH